MVSLIIGGDLYPTRRNLQHFLEGNSEKTFNDLNLEFQTSDLNLINLECPIIEEPTPIKKCGSIHGIEDRCIGAIKNAKIHVLNLANNHIMDHGMKGLGNTLDVCRKNGILTVGAGRNLKAARKILICKIDKFKIGILAIAEHEFSIANKNEPGANPLNLENIAIDIRKNENRLDYLVILFHGGNENYPYPSPRLQRVCRFFCELGADIVIVQHTHCPGCYEQYNGSHIIYGQGNLIFDSPNRQNLFYQGFLAKFEIRAKNDISLKLVPYIQSFNCIGARKMNEKEETIFMKGFLSRSDSIKKDDFVEEKWIQFCALKKKEYRNRVLGHNYIMKKLIRSKAFLKYFFPFDSRLRLQNTISCESHREVLETLFENEML